MRCRTCYENIAETEKFVSVDEIGWQDPQKTFTEIVLEIAGIDIKNDRCPESKHLCDECVKNIQFLFAFVRKIQKVNEQLLLLQHSRQNEESSFLEETPIDFPSTFNIKTDLDEYESEKTDFFKSSDQIVDIKVEDCLFDPMVQLEEEFQSNFSDFSEKADNSDEDDKKPLKRKRGRPRKASNSTAGNNSSSCEICGKSFIWHKDMIRHAKTHTMQPELKCDYCERLFLRRDKLNDHMKTHAKKRSVSRHQRPAKETEWSFGRRLYSKPLLKLLQCKLCDKQCSRISELKQHLMSHRDDESFSLASFKSKLLATRDEELQSQTENEIKTNISEGNFSPFYTIVNNYGYELSLSDSDETDGEERDDAHHSKYECSLCHETFRHQYGIFSHTLQEHLNSKLPFKCNLCKLQFVCEEMLHQHERRQCKNKARKIECSNCPGKFMWVENFENHQCPSKRCKPENCASSTRSRSKMNESEESQSSMSLRGTKKLQCTQCEKSFIWPKDLTRHMRIHLPDREKFQCPICQRSFNRKDNMHVHMKVHGEDSKGDPMKKSDGNVAKQSRVQTVDENLTKPHGCKVIECTICQSKQMRLSDLRVHLMKHQLDASYAERWTSVEKVGELLYPELGKSLTKDELIAHITADLAAQQYARFYSVTNEIGYELDLSSSETDTESESDSESEKLPKNNEKYKCGICGAGFDRKYKLFKHQHESHSWDEAPYCCSHCNARFVSAPLLEWHFDRQCKNGLKRFHCKKCPMRFMWKQNLHAHIRTAHADQTGEKQIGGYPNSLQCDHCGRTFIMQKDLTRHLLMQICHSQQSTEVTKCLYCPRKFYRKDNLEAHMTRHGVGASDLATAECLIRSTSKPNGQKHICCRVCNTSFGRIDDLRAHLLKETSVPLSQHYPFNSSHNYAISNSLGFELEIDDSETEMEYERENEGQVDSHLRSYQCAICNLTAKRKYEISQHQLSMHKYEQLPFKCERCIFRTVSQTILAQHMRSQCFNEDKKFQCEICRFKFMWQENLEIHMKLCHGDNKPNIQQLSESTNDRSIQKVGDHIIYQCYQCPCKYNRKDRLNAHIKRVHILQNNDNSITATTKKKSKSKANASEADGTAKPSLERKFLCAFCGRGLTSSSNLIIHMRRHTGEKPFKCDFCHMAFPRSSDLSAHRRKHTGERPHPCTICEKAFSRSYKLMLHMRTHTGERPHKCTYCEKSFSQSNDLTLHIRRHTGERPYVCGVCGERFIQGTALKNHRMMRGHYEETEDALPPTA